MDRDLQVLIEAQAALRGEVDDLTTVVDEIGVQLSAVADLLCARATSGGADINGWTSRSANLDLHAERLDQLTQWLEWANATFLPARTPSRSRPVPDCWRNHPGVVEELLALHAAWVAAYTTTDPNDTMIAWHDRWVEPCMTRVYSTYALSSCLETGHCRIAPRDPQGLHARRDGQA